MRRGEHEVAGRTVDHRAGADQDIAVRERVTDTLQQAKARLAATSAEAVEAAETIAEKTDSYVRKNPWQSVAIAALLGGAAVYLFTKASRRD